MGRKSKYSEEDKIKACNDYQNGEGSFSSIAERLGTSPSTIRCWYYSYLENGPNAFAYSSRNKSYTKEYKLEIIKLYLSRKYSLMDVHAKYKISKSVLSKWLKKYYNGIELKDYDPKGDVYTMESRNTTFEERLEIVKWTIANDMNYKLAADKYVIKYALIYQWVKKYTKDGENGLKHKKRGPKAKGAIEESSLSEIEKLKLELEKEKALRKRVEFSLEVHKKKEEFARKLHIRK